MQATRILRIELSNTAQEVSDFDYRQRLFTPFFSSAYKDFESSFLLIDYSGTAAGMNRIAGLDPAQNIVFSVEYAGGRRLVEHNADPI